MRMAYNTPFSVTVDVHGPRPKSRVSFSLLAIRSFAMATAWAVVACLRVTFIAERRGAPARSQPAFFVVVHVEKETDAVRMRTELRDVCLVVFEVSIRQFAE